jgi:hypothetical protein
MSHHLSYMHILFPEEKYLIEKDHCVEEEFMPELTESATPLWSKQICLYWTVSTLLHPSEQ